MLKEELFSHFSVSLVYLLLISLFNFGLGWRLIFFGLGILFGTFLLDFDHFLIAWNQENKAWWAERFRYLWQKREYKKAIFHLAESHLEHRHLIFHSVICQPLLLFLAFFVLTSTSSLFGKGLVMSLNLHLLKDEWHTVLTRKSLGWIFWPVKRPLQTKTHQLYLFTVTAVFLLLTLLLL